jgi:ribosome-associated heat shock protein Hsp15
MLQEVRIDKWLWAVRLFKTRTLAAVACKGDKVTINDEPVKPSRDIRVGEIITARLPNIKRTVKVKALLEKRIGAKLVDDYLEDLTPAEEYLKALQASTPQPGIPQRERGSGRPTKKDRRDLEKTQHDLS